MHNNRDKLIKALLILGGLLIGVTALSMIQKHNSLSLSEYAGLHPEFAEKNTLEAESADESIENTFESGDISKKETEKKEELEVSMTENLQYKDVSSPTEPLTGAFLNANTMEEQRITYKEGFYFEPLSDKLKRYITGVSFPESPENKEKAAIRYEELRYVHIMHYDFDGNPAEGELICNERIAQDLTEIFYELYRNEYHLEKVLLIDEYNGDDTASMEDNNSSCFNYRTLEGTDSLSKHALGLAVDINPFYNPYVTYDTDGKEIVSPAGSEDYADRTAAFPYKIDENDLCYKLFTEHGFTWGGNWNSCKDYQHFQFSLE